MAKKCVINAKADKLLAQEEIWIQIVAEAPHFAVLPRYRAAVLREGRLARTRRVVAVNLTFPVATRVADNVLEPHRRRRANTLVPSEKIIVNRLAATLRCGATLACWVSTGR
jgi:hypothetical protein